MGSRPAKSEMKSRASGVSRMRSMYERAIWRMCGSCSATRRGVKPLETSPRMRPCMGGSMPRNDMVLWACGPDADGSSDTPCELDRRSKSRNPSITSACLDSAQKPSSSLR